MRRILNPFVLILTSLVVLLYAYAAARLTSDVFARVLLALPFFCVWAVPVLYWVGERAEKRRHDHVLHMASYLSMGWLSFLGLFLILRDGLLITSTTFGLDSIALWLAERTNGLVIGLASIACVFGAIVARRGPKLREVDVYLPNLPEALEGFRIVQISDLHVGPTIHRPYVERVVEKALDLNADLVAFTGDIVDGSIAELRDHVAPLKRLAVPGRAFFVLGNHDYYSGAARWTEFFRDMGFRVLLNEHAYVRHEGATILVGGVLDPAVRMLDREARPDPERAMHHGEAAPSGVLPDLRLLLAHNPKLAAEGAKAGFDLQLSGHTHAGQFVPWTLVTRLVHQPHYAGLSNEGPMRVYVSAGTGTWGPPIRVGTSPELTLLRLRKDLTPSPTRT